MRIHFLIKFLIVCFCTGLFFTNFLYSQVKFYAEVDNKTVGKNEYIQVQFTVKDAHKVDQIVPPSFNNFNIVSGPSQQSGMLIVNGAVSQSQSIVYVLQPKHTGRLIIGEAIATADGKQFRSQPLSIEVSNRSVNNSPPPNPFPFAIDEPMTPTIHEYDDYILKKGESVPEKIKKNVFVKLDVSKTSCFVGEPLVATYKLYSRLKSESNITKTPSFNGFSVNEIGRAEVNNLNPEKINGREYNVYLLRKVELYPLQSGRIELEPLSVENKITFIEDMKNKSMDNMQNMLQNLANGGTSDGLIEETVTLKNKPVFIDVKPLPKTEDPGFKGAVGSFSIKNDFENPSVYQEDGGTLKVTVSGSGNIQLINAPKVIWPGGIEGFEPTSSEKIDKTSVPINGERIFKFPFSISKAGTYHFSPIIFTYFDINTKLYKTIKTTPLTLYVKQGIGHRPTVNEVKNISNANFPLSTWIIIIGLILMTVFVFFFIKKEKRNKNEIIKSKEIEIQKPDIHLISPANPFANLENLMDHKDSNLFYSTFKDDLSDYLSLKLNILKTDLNRKKINEALDNRGVYNVTILLMNELLDDIDLHLYSASSPELEKRIAYEKAMELVKLLEKQIS